MRTFSADARRVADRFPHRCRIVLGVQHALRLPDGGRDPALGGGQARRGGRRFRVRRVNSNLLIKMRKEVSVEWKIVGNTFIGWSNSNSSLVSSFLSFRGGVLKLTFLGGGGESLSE